ncbi:MAG: helix-turn-helix transcriptional regulator [Pseudomonadota bacterium]
MITNPLDLHLGKKLREIRTMAGMSQAQVGELIGVSLQQIRKYEIGFSRISASKLYEFSQIFHKPIGSFFDDYIADEDFHNIEFKSEAECRKLEEEKNQEMMSLIRAFNRIRSFEVRGNLISLLKSIADKN